MNPSELGVGGWESGDGVMAGMAFPLPSSILDRDVSFPSLRRTVCQPRSEHSLWTESCDDCLDFSSSFFFFSFASSFLKCIYLRLILRSMHYVVLPSMANRMWKISRSST